MKLLSHFLILFTILSCANNENPDSNTLNDITPVNVQLSNDKKGMWVAETYLNALKETKSTKKASANGQDVFYNINQEGLIQVMSMHEGTNYEPLIMTSETEGKIYNLDTTEIKNKVVFSNDFLFVDDKKFLKAPDTSYSLNKFVNQHLLSGKYSIDGTEIEFQTDGNISGWDEYYAFFVYLDYMDVAMDFDKIDFLIKDQKTPETFIYEFKSDTLFLRELICDYRDEKSDLCQVIKPGPIKYVLIKIQ